MSNYDLIIIGAGPAGNTCAIYATRANLKTLVIDNGAPGGQVNLTETIDNYPGLPNIGGFELGEKMYQHSEALGAEYIFDNITEINLEDEIKTIKTEYSGDFSAKAVVIATGASPRRLGAKGEEKLLGKGVGYCATCDGAFAKGKVVAVVGGGNAAIEEALYLTRIAQKVYVFHILQELQCNKVLQQQLEANPKIEVMFGTKVIELIGDKTIEKAKIEQNGTEKEVELGGLFVSIGRVPNSKMFNLKKDQAGYIIAGQELETSTKGVFVAGDVRQKTLRQIVTACADGAIAADSVAKYLK